MLLLLLLRWPLSGGRDGGGGRRCGMTPPNTRSSSTTNRCCRHQFGWVMTNRRRLEAVWLRAFPRANHSLCAVLCLLPQQV